MEDFVQDDETIVTLYHDLQIKIVLILCKDSRVRVN